METPPGLGSIQYNHKLLKDLKTPGLNIPAHNIRIMTNDLLSSDPSFNYPAGAPALRPFPPASNPFHPVQPSFHPAPPVFRPMVSSSSHNFPFGSQLFNPGNNND
jgi:hypothetical protein